MIERTITHETWSEEEEIQSILKLIPNNDVPSPLPAENAGPDTMTIIIVGVALSIFFAVAIGLSVKCYLGRVSNLNIFTVSIDQIKIINFQIGRKDGFAETAHC